MANEKKLDCVILGLLSHEDLTGYEIKKRMDTVLKYFWSASYGSIYPTLKELADRKLATKTESKESGREKITYTITKEGRKYLKDWLTIPVDKDELRYETLLKLFFGHEAGAPASFRHVENFEEKIRDELPQLMAMAKTLEEIAEDDETHLHYLLTVKFGVKGYQAYLEWCNEAKALLS